MDSDFENTTCFLCHSTQNIDDMHIIELDLFDTIVYQCKKCPNYIKLMTTSNFHWSSGHIRSNCSL